MSVRRAESGIAIVTVIVMLAALMLIAAPFALSMRRMESGALLAADQEGARAGALAALAAAERHLEDTHPFYDLETPHVDTREELFPRDLPERFAGQLDRNPRGAVRSVQVQDEQGKVHLPTASYFLLSNIFGGRTSLSANAGALDDRLEVVDTHGFAPTGLLWVGHEAVEYSGLEPKGFVETRRGQPLDAVPTSKAREHEAGADVFDLRVLLLARHGWRHRPGVFDVFRRIDAVKNIGLYGPMTYTASEVEAVRDLVTVHGAPVAWRDRQRVRKVERAKTLAPALIVDDASMWGAGTVLTLTNAKGGRDWALVDRVYRWDDAWRVELFDVLIEDHDEQSSVEALRREPININTCPMPVLQALLTGVGRQPLVHIVDPDAAIALAFEMPVQRNLDLTDVIEVLEEQLEAGMFVERDVVLARDLIETEQLRLDGLEVEEIVPYFVGLEQAQATLRVGEKAARAVALRIRAAQPASHSELRAVLNEALGEGDINAVQREALMRNAINPGDAWLTGGTAPFTYSSAGRFTLTAAASENLPSGKERARAYVRRLSSIAPGGETAHQMSTQADFERALALGPGGAGWTSHPSPLSLGGVGVASALGGTPQAKPLFMPRGDTLASFREALSDERRPPSRTEAFVSGGPSPSNVEVHSFIAQAPVRSALENTVHFDEGVSGLVGSSPKGFSFDDQGSLTLPIADIEPKLISSIGRLERFTVDFWFELDGIPEDDVLLFDTGIDELEDRILIALLGGELVFRIHDAGLPDFEVDVGETGLVPPTGEIRYAFDDGLSLLPGVAYHVLADVGGAGPGDMALFVDGIPRGRASFSTFLTADVEPSGSSGSLLSNGVERLPVDSTAGFPRQGVLSVGTELIEYIDLDDDAFVVGPLDQGDPFGGRARRYSSPAEHLEGASVTLAGYSIPLASEIANTGNATLAAALGEFGVAMLDADRLDESINASVLTSTGTTPVEVKIGTGLSATETQIPVTSAGSAGLDGETFSSSGGYAMIVAVHNSYSLTIDVPGGSIGETFRFPQRTVDGDVIDGVEIIRYSGYNGSTLTGCSRNSSGEPAATSGPSSDLAGGSFGAGGLNQGTSFAEPRVFVTEFDGALTASGQIPDLPRVLIVPLSIPVAGGGPYEEYAPRPEIAPEVSNLAQIGLDFGEEQDDVTEWVRWNTSTNVGLVRDDEDAVDDTITLIESLNLWNPDVSSVDDDSVDAINLALDMRAQCGTPDVAHSDGETILPTHLFGGWNVDAVSMMDDGYAAPGRQDAITLVDITRGDDGEIVPSKEWHRINHAALDLIDGASDPLSNVWIVGLRDPVSGDFVFTDSLDYDNYGIEDGQVDEQLDSEDTGYDTAEWLQADIRLVTRMIKAPSRELPTGPLETFAIGRDFGGRPSAGGVTIDELRFTTRAHELDLVPTTAQFVLAEELEDDESFSLRVDLSAMRYPHALISNGLLAPDGLDAVGMLSEHGGLLRVGDEIVSYAGFDAEDTGGIFLTARGLYGTREQAHPARTPISTLNYWPAQPLSSRVTDETSTLPFENPKAFPAGGGLVLVGDELIGYSQVVDRALTMPRTAGITMISQRGLLRGRFGTTPSSHEAGALVRWMPMRYRDQSLLGSRHAASEHAALTVDAPGAYFTDLAIAARIAAEGSRLDVRGVFDRRDTHHADVEDNPAVFALASDGTGDIVVLSAIGRQASVVDLHLAAGWQLRAFDPVGFASNGWKVVPEVTSITLAHHQPTIVWEHEEWR